MGKKNKNVEENSPESITYEKSDERDENLAEVDADEKPKDDSKDSSNEETDEKESKEPEENNVESEEVGIENGKPDAENEDSEKQENEAASETSIKKKKNQSENEKSDKEKDGDEKSDEELPLGTLDQPVVILENKRSRKSITKYDNSKDVKKNSLDDVELDYSLGKGVLLKEIPFIKYQIQIAETEDLVVLHRLMYRKAGKLSEMKQNIRNFRGYPFDEKSKHYTAAKSLASRITTPGLKFLNGILGLEVSKDGIKMENDILEFLKEPKDLGLEVPERILIEPRKSKRKVPKRRGRRNPKRNQGLPKGYAMVSESESDGEGSDEDDVEESEDEKPATRGRRSNSSRKTAKKSEEEDLDNESEEEKTSSKRKAPSRGAKNGKRNKEDSDLDDGHRRSKRSRSSRSNGVNKTSDSDGTEEESDSENEDKKQKAKKKGSRKVKKEKTTPARSSGRTSRRSYKNDTEDEDEESVASDDEPLSKKNKSLPTNAELKKVISRILKGVNLDSVTMKNIVQQVYGEYPSLDLVPKKEFIKKTVKDML